MKPRFRTPERKETKCKKEKKENRRRITPNLRKPVHCTEVIRIPIAPESDQQNLRGKIAPEEKRKKNRTCIVYMHHVIRR